MVCQSPVGFEGASRIALFSLPGAPVRMNTRWTFTCGRLRPRSGAEVRVMLSGPHPQCSAAIPGGVRPIILPRRRPKGPACQASPSFVFGSLSAANLEGAVAGARLVDPSRRAGRNERGHDHHEILT